jgi:hypothetical protein
MNNVPETVLQGVEKILEDKGALAGNITRDQVASTIRECISSELSLFKSLASTASSQPPHTNQSISTYMWDGSFHRLPEAFKFPECDVLTGWELWMEGNKEENLPPFRNIEPRDLSQKAQRKILSDWKCLYTWIESTLNQKGMLILSPTHEQVQKMFADITTHLPRPNLTGKNKRRRPGQLHVTTQLRLLRSHLKFTQ